jgi:hypothetical protein
MENLEEDCEFIWNKNNLKTPSSFLELIAEKYLNVYDSSVIKIKKKINEKIFELIKKFLIYCLF